MRISNFITNGFETASPWLSRYCVIVILLVVTAGSTSGQEASISQSDSTAIHKLLKRGQALLVRYPDSSLHLVRDAYELSQKLDYAEGMAQSLNTQQSYHFFRNEIEEARRVAREGLSVARNAGLQHVQVIMLGHLSRLAMVNSQIDSGFYFLVEAEQIARQLGRPDILAKHLFEWASYFYNTLDTVAAEKPIIEAISLLEGDHNKGDQRYAVYLAVQHYSLTNNQLERARWLNKYLELKSEESHLLGEYDFYHQNVLEVGYPKNPEIRRQKIESDLILHQKYGNDYGAFYNALYLAGIYHELGDLRRAEHFFLQAVHHDYTTIRGSFSMAAQREAASFYRDIGRHEKALDHFLEYTRLKDSLQNVEMRAVSQELNTKYQTAQKEARLARQEATLSEQRTQQNQLMFALIGLGIVLALVAGFLIYRLRLQRLLESKNTVIQNALDEKEILLKEIHHRVKNNLQVISGLLKWQSSHIKDAKALHAMNEGQNRVHSMAIIHQKLYQSDNLTGIDMDDYIKRLSQSLFNSYNIKNEQIVLTTDIESLNLDIDTVIPLGLILNELISNALKHAFPGETRGEIAVKLHKDEAADELLLSVNDNGVGMTEGGSTVRSDSFGWELIDTLSQKLKANVDISQEQGTRIQLRIKNYKVA